MKPLTIALAGNPNAGKTTIFNVLCGSTQHVGNWPGKTIEKKTGRCRHNGWDIELVDLPGTYSLSAYSFEEIVARDYIIDSRPDAVIVVVDAANLERNLYLAVQVLELQVPTVLALNMVDVAASRGYEIDTEHLSKVLGVPVVATVARSKRGLRELLEVVTAVASSREPSNHAG